MPTQYCGRCKQNDLQRIEVLPADRDSKIADIPHVHSTETAIVAKSA